MRLPYATLIATGLQAFVGSAQAATLVVDTTSDVALSACTAAANDCSLRGALNAANASATPDTIAFAIPTTDPGCSASSGICRIAPQSALPDIVYDLVIDGFTQPGATPNTIAADQGGLDAAIKIELIPSVNLSFAAALRTCGPNLNHNITVRGLAIAGAFQRAIDYYASCISGTLTGAVRIEGNFIGTDATGAAVTPRIPNGIGIGSFSGSTTGAVIGGLAPAQRNLISNLGVGIDLYGFNHQVLGNLIGTDVTGLTGLGNGGVGVVCRDNALAFYCLIGDGSANGRNIISANDTSGINLEAHGPSRIRGNYIGANAAGMPLGNTSDGILVNSVRTGSGLPTVVGGTPSEGNLIAYNHRAGILVAGTGQSISGNIFHDNAHLGIWFGNSGHAVNDAGDGDNGANKGQNHPAITASTSSAGMLDIDYRVDTSTANAAYPLRIEFYKAAGDEGLVYLGSDNYPGSSAQALKSVALALPVGVSVSPDDVVIATATDADGNTSEFSWYPATLSLQAPTVPACAVVDTIYCDGFEPLSIAHVTAVASGGPFKPNGTVHVTSGASSCSFELLPTPTPSTSGGSCLLGVGGPGPITITATLDALTSAFAAPDGTSASATATFNP